ncbi:hypothetical protein P7C70_g8364, partial [Phenoliferia sp. Uapishka_3]
MQSPRGKLARKAPPPITDSVIRQAGAEAVFGSAPTTPSLFQLSQSQNSDFEFLDVGLPQVHLEPFSVPSPSMILGGGKTKADASKGAEDGMDEMGRSVGGGKGYASETGKKRADDKWDETMAEFERALQ